MNMKNTIKCINDNQSVDGITFYTKSLHNKLYIKGVYNGICVFCRIASNDIQKYYSIKRTIYVILGGV